MGQLHFAGIDAARSQRSRSGRVVRGLSAQASGAAAERLVEDRYAALGCAVLARRWRGPSGEIDLILRDGGAVVFVEVKKSETHDIAARRISRRQMDRICNAALEFCAEMAQGLMTLMRFDAALVDAGGRVEIVENAFGQH